MINVSKINYDLDADLLIYETLEKTINELKIYSRIHPNTLIVYEQSIIPYIEQQIACLKSINKYKMNLLSHILYILKRCAKIYELHKLEGILKTRLRITSYILVLGIAIAINYSSSSKELEVPAIEELHTSMGDLAKILENISNEIVIEKLEEETKKEEERSIEKSEEEKDSGSVDEQVLLETDEIVVTEDLSSEENIALNEVNISDKSGEEIISTKYVVGRENEILPGYHLTYGNTTYENISEEDILLLGYVIGHEAAESYEDALGGVSVVLNRLEDPRYPNTILEIVSAPDQFAVWNADEAYKTTKDDIPRYVWDAIIEAVYDGGRNNDYVEFNWKNSKAKSVTGELKYQIVDGGNKYHNLAISLGRLTNTYEDAYFNYENNSQNTDEKMLAKVFSE